MNSVPPYRTIVSLRPRSRDSRLCCSGKSTGLILFYISICPYRQISIYLHIYISLLIPLILCGFSRGMASRWRSRNPGRLVEAKSFCFLLALLTLDGEKGCCLSGFVRCRKFVSFVLWRHCWFLCIPGRRRCKQGSRKPLARL